MTDVRLCDGSGDSGDVLEGVLRVGGSGGSIVRGRCSSSLAAERSGVLVMSTSSR